MAASAGLVLDEWQRLVLEHGLGVRDDGAWAAFEVGLNVARQNGKGGVIEARELAGLFLFGEQLIIHTAHNFSTAREAFLRLTTLIEMSPALDAQVRKINASNTEWGVTLKSGQRLQYRTRTKGGARGFSAPTLIFDEAMFLPEYTIGAVMPIVSAMEHPQIWYAGSAVDQAIHEDGVVFARVRERGLKGDDPSLAYFEWSAGVASPDDLDEAMLADEGLWAQANPALGIRIAPEHVANEQRSMDARTFAVERLGVGDWPRTDGTADSMISPEQWALLTDAASSIVGPVCFAFDVSPDRAWASIAASGVREDGLAHVEIVDRRRGTSWLPARLGELCEAHEVGAVLCDASGPAASLLHELVEVDPEITVVSARDHANACGLLFDRVDEMAVRHLGTPELTAAVKGATTRPLGDAWAWSRKSASVDISPLVAVTLALFGGSSLVSTGDFILDTRVAA